MTITSCAPVFAFRRPTIPPYIPAAIIPAISARDTCSTGVNSNLNPTYDAAIAPKINWPCAPILNNPDLKASATASPVRINGMAFTTVSESG